MQYLSRDDILDLHGYVVERFGGRLGFNSQDRLLSLVQATNQTMFGSPLYPDLPAKIAVVAFALIKNRPFRSGNTATALLAVLRFAEINDHTIDDVGALTTELMAVAQSDRNKDQLTAWFGAHLIERITHHSQQRDHS